MIQTEKISFTAIIVSYNPDVNALDRLLQRLQSQLKHILVVDNASKNQSAVEQACSGVSYHGFDVNKGLGSAHNYGIKQAQINGSSHVLLLDQDSLPDKDFFKQMSLAVLQLTETNKRYSGIGARYCLNNLGQLSGFVCFGWLTFSRVTEQDAFLVAADFLISSGTVISLAAINAVGLMDESLFIDHVDTEWFLRAADKGYQAYGCNKAFMQHALGERHVRLWFGRWRNVPYHKPFRYYYIFRNSILLYKRHYAPLKWKLADIVRLVQIFLFFGVFAPDRLANLSMIWRGIIDGIKGRSGSMQTESHY